MSIFMGGRGKGPTRINDLAIQTSSQGVALTRGWGTGRCKVNLFWYGDFHSVTKKQKAGGKGAPKTTSYTYFASVMMGIAAGPISSVLTVYRDKESLSVGASGLSIALGTIGQSTWGYLTTNHPTQALPYSGIAYAYAANYPLTDSASLSNHSMEVQFPVRVSGKADANPAAIIQDVMENTYNGVRGWQSGLLGSLTDYSNYCLASGLLLSPILEGQTKIAEFIEGDLIDATNSMIFWSEGVLKVKPLGDTSVTGNSVTWTPDLTPVYDFNESDFLETPKLEILDQTDAYNRVEIEYLNRANQYNTAVEPAFDLSNIIEFGERKEDTQAIHSICDKAVAVKVANLRLQRSLYMREQYTFTVEDSFVLLEQGDIVTLTTSTDGMLLDRLPVRILEINEEGDNGLQMLAEALIDKSASSATYNTHPSEGYTVDTSQPGGPVTNPSIINAPLSLTDGNPEVWMAVSSDNPLWAGCEVWASSDDTDYTYVGRIEQSGRYGDLTAALASHVDPDASGTFSVDLSDSRGILASVSNSARDVGATLSLIGSELISYKDALLTTTSNYSVSNLRRGLYGSVPALHAIGSRFTRLDEDVFKLPYDRLGLGTVAYFKFLSYNLWGNALEQLGDVVAYSTTLIPLNSGIIDFGAYSLVMSPNLFFDNAKVTKIGGTTGWNEQAYSIQGYEGSAEISFKVETEGSVVVGLNSDPVTNANYTSIDFGLAVNAAMTSWEVLESGSSITSGSLAVGDLLTITYKGTSVVYKKNGTVIRTSTTTANRVFYADSSFYEIGSSVSSLTFTSPGNIGTAGTNGNNIGVIYRRSATPPSTPAASSPPPSGWYTDPASVPASSNPMWASYGIQTAGTGNYTWQTPVQIEGTAGAPGLSDYTWYAYSDAPDGTYNFVNGAPGNRSYQGIAFNKTTPTESTNPADYAWSPYIGPPNFGLAAFDSNTILSANKLIKVGGGSGWNASIHSTESFKGGASVTFIVDTSSSFMVGLNTDPTTDSSYTSLDFAIYIAGTTLQVYESNNLMYNVASFVSVGDVFTVTYNGKIVTYSKNGVIFYTNSSPAAGLTLFLDSSILTPHPVTVGRILAFVPAGTAGSDGTNGVSPVSAVAIPLNKQFTADSDGTVKAGQLPFNIAISGTKAGATIGGTVTIGTPSGCTATAISGGFTIDTVSADAGFVPWTFTATDGQVVEGKVSFSRQRDPASGGQVSVNFSSTSWWGSGSYGSSGPSTVLPASSTGKLAIAGYASFYCSGNGEARLTAKLQYRAVGSGTWIDSGFTSGPSIAIKTPDLPGEPGENTPGEVNPTGTLTGLTANGSYEVQMVGSRNASYNAIAAATGFITLAQVL